MKHTCLFLLATALFLLFSACQGGGSTPLSGVKEALYGFEHPQDSTRTKVWWFHGETETTRSGITADLEAFRRQGVGGVVYYDQVHSKAEGAVEAFSPHWWEMLLFAAQEAQRLGLSFEAHVSNGYVAGGPWITPDLGMQRLTAVDTVIQGGRSVEIALPVPPSTLSYYKDVAVLAYPYQAERHEDSRTVQPKLTCNLHEMDANLFVTPTNRPPQLPVQAPGESVYITLDFGKPFTARSLTYTLSPRGKATTSATNVPGPPGETFVGTGYRVLPDPGTLEVSNDNIHFRTVCPLKPIYTAHSNWKQKTVSFPAVTGRFFRLNLHDWCWEDGPQRPLGIGNLVLSARACIDQWEEKAALYAEYIEGDKTPTYPADEVIDPAQLIDLTALLDSSGTLRWEAPAGQWLVMRFAHVPTGVKTKHGRRNLMGLECDKLSAVAAEVQWNHYFKAIADSIEAHGGQIQGMAMDSHEAGSQNWTPSFEKEFERLRGYNLLRYLPVLAGYVVESKAVSDGFLYDVRRTVADLMAEHYYGTFNRLCTERGLTFTAQAIGNALCIAGDPIQAKGRVQKPQGEFWGIHPDGNYDIKECSSAAHLYGKSIASGEAFTDVGFDRPLSYIKQLADYAYAFGLNEFVVCASAYQPWKDKVPGNTGGGRQYCLNRNNPFWEYSRDFWDYQARLSYLMRQGRPVIDLCLYLGDNAPVKILTYRLPEIPPGYDFDAFTTDALLTRMQATNGRITLPDGLSYSMMILPRNGEIPLEALRKIATLVKDGATVYGPRPTGSGSLRERAFADEYQKLTEQLWGATPSPEGTHTYGKRRVCWGMSLSEAIVLADLQPDLTLPAGRKLYYTHRTLHDGDLYFIDNHEDTPLTHTFTFRCHGKLAELWHPVSGRRYALESKSTADGRTSVSLQLAARESMVIVFHNDETLPPPLPLQGETDEEVRSLDGAWQVTFDTRLGGPGTVVFPTLTDWRLHPDSRIRYYSGTAVYQHTVMVDTLRPEAHYLLRFDRLGAVARVWLNGKEVGTVWCSPYEIDLTEQLQKGENLLEIEVANALTNRLIGDSMLPPEQRITYSTTPIASPADTLLPSGIIGAVNLVVSTPASAAKQ